MLLTRIRKKMQIIIWVFAIFFGISIFYVFGAQRVGCNRPGGVEQKTAFEVHFKQNDGSIAAIKVLDGEFTEKTEERFAMMAKEQNEMRKQMGMPVLTSLDQLGYIEQLFVKLTTIRMIGIIEALSQEARKRNVTISSEELDNAMAARRDYVLSRYGLDPVRKVAGSRHFRAHLDLFRAQRQGQAVQGHSRKPHGRPLRRIQELAADAVAGG